MRFRWIAETEVSPGHALGTGAALYAGLGAADAPPLVLYGASLTGDVVVLGQYQRALDALDVAAVDARGAEVIRRSTGGPACLAGHGIVYLALALRHGSVLMECPRDRVLNRNVRGLLGGLALTGARANYFGRDHLAVDKRPAALVGWTRDADGAVLLEAFLSIDRPYTIPSALDGYRTREDMTTSAKEPITMREVWEGPRRVEDLVRLVAEGHLDRFGDVELELDHSSTSDAERSAAEERSAKMIVGFDDAWDPHAWSETREVPIGFVSAGVTLDDAGAIEHAVVAGDFYQDEEAPLVLAKKLAGASADRDTITSAVDAAWDGQNRVVEGLKDFAPVVDALVDAAAAG